MEPLKLAEVIGKARKKKGMSLRELSRKTGISHPYLSQIETGKNDNPSKEFLLKLADVLILPFAFLISISSTDMGLSKDLPKDVIDKYRYYIPPYIDTIDSASSFINLCIGEKEIKKHPDYYTDEKLKQIAQFFYEVKAIEKLTKEPSAQHVLDVLKNISTTQITKNSDRKLTTPLNEFLFLENIEITVNEKPLTEQDKLKLLEIANTIFR